MATYWRSGMWFGCGGLFEASPVMAGRDTNSFESCVSPKVYEEERNTTEDGTRRKGFALLRNICGVATNPSSISISLLPWQEGKYRRFDMPVECAFPRQTKCSVGGVTSNSCKMNVSQSVTSVTLTSVPKNPSLSGCCRRATLANYAHRIVFCGNRIGSGTATNV